MNRYGAERDELPALISAVHDVGLTQIGWSVHPPLDGTAQSHAAEISDIISSVDSNLPWFVSHVDAKNLADLRKKIRQSKKFVYAVAHSFGSATNQCSNSPQMCLMCVQ